MGEGTHVAGAVDDEQPAVRQQLRKALSNEMRGGFINDRLAGLFDCPSKSGDS